MNSGDVQGDVQVVGKRCRGHVHGGHERDKCQVGAIEGWGEWHATMVARIKYLVEEQGIDRRVALLHSNASKGRLSCSLSRSYYRCCLAIGGRVVGQGKGGRLYGAYENNQ